MTPIKRLKLREVKYLSRVTQQELGESKNLCLKSLVVWWHMPLVLTLRRQADLSF